MDAHQHGYQPHHQHGYNPPNQGRTTCAFPSPPARTVYCMPAPFSQVNGQKYQSLPYAYGQPRVMSGH